MGASTTRFKVRREDLIARVKEVQAEELAKYEADKAKYAAAKPSWLEDVAAYYETQAAKIRKRAQAAARKLIADAEKDAKAREAHALASRKGRVPERGRDYDRPSAPSEPYKPSGHVSTLRGLALSADEFITVTTDNQWRRYL